ncbi:MAG: peptidoglycan DD-metalloendopeptidase family protein [Gemmatimonadetes bacterium]|nr:peptidoglycan DD-metalloendopeptidase family protein [Gemmatimonadota bacterium]
MKRIIRVLPLFLLLLVAPAVFADLAPAGGGEYVFERYANCLTPEARADIQSRIDANVAVLRAEGRLLEESSKKVFMEWPLAAAPSYTHYGFHAVSGFVDQNLAPGTLDWNCGAITYDGHMGTDYYLWPFDWNLVAQDAVHVVAGMRGVITLKDDGYPDTSCDWVTNPNWNAVYVQHADNSVAWYGHMKSGSLTAKSVGDTVETGEYLGVVASSGVSTGPHLHLEMKRGNGTLIDPYAGPCNGTTAGTWWASQPPYYDSGINALMTHDAPLQWQACPNQHVTNEENFFGAGSTVYTAAYYRDQLAAQNTVYTIYRPDNSIWQTWNHASGASHYSSSYWYWTWNLPASPQEGWWKFEAVYEGGTYEHSFVVGNPTAVAAGDAVPRADRLSAHPNPFNPSTTITYVLAEPGHLAIDVFDARGALVRTLVDREARAGEGSVVWNGSDARGASVPSGTYFARYRGNGEEETQKIVLLR